MNGISHSANFSSFFCWHDSKRRFLSKFPRVQSPITPRLSLISLLHPLSSLKPPTLDVFAQSPPTLIPDLFSPPAEALPERLFRYRALPRTLFQGSRFSIPDNLFFFAPFPPSFTPPSNFLPLHLPLSKFSFPSSTIFPRLLPHPKTILSSSALLFWMR